MFSAVLRVQVKCASGVKHNGDSFVKIEFHKDEAHPFEQQTTTALKGSDPIWEEDLYFFVQSYPKFKATLKHKGMLSDSNGGHVHILRKDTPERVFLLGEKYYLEEGHGASLEIWTQEIDISQGLFGYCLAKENLLSRVPIADQAFSQRVLVVVIHSASGLPSHLLREANSYAKIELSGAQKMRTLTVKNTPNPVWEREMQFLISQGDDKARFTVEVFDEEIGFDKELGKCTIGFTVGESKSHRKYALDKHGEIEVSVTAMPLTVLFDNLGGGEEDEQKVPAPSAPQFSNSVDMVPPSFEDANVPPPMFISDAPPAFQTDDIRVEDLPPPPDVTVAATGSAPPKLEAQITIGDFLPAYLDESAPPKFQAQASSGEEVPAYMAEAEDNVTPTPAAQVPDHHPEVGRKFVSPTKSFEETRVYESKDSGAKTKVHITTTKSHFFVQPSSAADDSSEMVDFDALAQDLAQLGHGGATKSHFTVLKASDTDDGLEAVDLAALAQGIAQLGHGTVSTKSHVKVVKAFNSDDVPGMDDYEALARARVQIKHGGATKSASHTDDGLGAVDYEAMTEEFKRSEAARKDWKSLLLEDPDPSTVHHHHHHHHLH
eukprot:TRINITY_DN7356_c0_g1_i1.p1 TRINITY_DN7356_c0_g1~~TRINITY_DN7356_c0_g1_i1.p1  ORF type:complete len:603 (-),score=192.38 TRINITY_DN7356_c0_g1_i1:1511-3319(-)